jgi:hypothetical protein
MPDVLTSTYTNTSTGVKEFQDTVWEDRENVIQMISPDDTPFISAIGTVKVKNRLHEWLEDELKTPTGSNAAVEGADAASTARTQPAVLSNYTQILEDTFKISATAEYSDTIGRDPVKYETDKSMKYLNTELEYAALNNTTASVGSTSAGRTFKGLAGFVSTNDKSYSSYASSNDFNEAKLMEMAESCYNAGGKPSMLLVRHSQAKKISDWDQNGRITVNTSDSSQTLVMSVMTLVTPFGRVKVTLDRFIAQATSTDQYDTVYLLDPSKISLGVMRPFKTIELAKQGDARKFQSIWEGTLVVHSEKAHAKCAKCATDAPAS